MSKSKRTANLAIVSTPVEQTPVEITEVHEAEIVDESTSLALVSETPEPTIEEQICTLEAALAVATAERDNDLAPMSGDTEAMTQISDQIRTLRARLRAATVGDAIADAQASLAGLAAGVAAGSVAVSDKSTRDASWNGHVDEEGAERAKIQERLAVALGHDLLPPVYEIGTIVNSTGVANARAFRAEFEAMPDAIDACQDFRSKFKMEERHDYRLQIRQMIMLPDGSIAVNGSVIDDETGEEISFSEPLKVEREAMKSIIGDVVKALPRGSMVPRSASQYMENCPPDLRAINFNHWQQITAAKVEKMGLVIPAMRDKDGKVIANALATLSDPEVARTKIRTRKDGDRRGIYANVSESYTNMDADHAVELLEVACKMIKAKTGADLRARIDYNGRTTRATIVTHSTVNPEKYVAGEIFRAAAFMGWDDTGSGSLWGHGSVDRNRCRNLIIVQCSEAGSFRVDHRGGFAKIIKELVAGLTGAFESVAAFGSIWSQACNSSLLLPEATADLTAALKTDRGRAEVFALNAASLITKRSGSSYLMDMPGSSDDSRVAKIVPDLLRMWKKDLEDGASSAIQKDGGLTTAAMVNALTRYAHEIDKNKERGSRLEAAAGSLLTAKRPVYKLVDPAVYAEWEVTPADLVTKSGIC